MTKKEKTISHTPGPWTFERHGKESNYFGNIIGHYTERTVRTITCQLRYGTDEEQEANAHLIAAAPDLLEALKGFMKAVEWESKIRVEWDRANDAIAKAKGEA